MTKYMDTVSVDFILKFATRSIFKIMLINEYTRILILN